MAEAEYRWSVKPKMYCRREPERKVKGTEKEHRNM